MKPTKHKGSGIDATKIRDGANGGLGAAGKSFGFGAATGSCSMFGRGTGAGTNQGYCSKKGHSNKTLMIRGEVLSWATKSTTKQAIA